MKKKGDKLIVEIEGKEVFLELGSVGRRNYFEIREEEKMVGRGLFLRSGSEVKQYFKKRANERWKGFSCRKFTFPPNSKRFTKIVFFPFSAFEEYFANYLVEGSNRLSDLESSFRFLFFAERNLF